MFEYKRQANPQDLPEGYWKDYPADKTVRAKLRPLTNKVMRKLSAQATTTRTVRENGRMVPKEEIDTEQLHALIIDYIFEDWAGILEDGAPIPLSPQNKLDVTNRYNQFSLWAQDTAWVVAEIEDTLREKKKDS